jgi:hypothetical protein
MSSYLSNTQLDDIIDYLEFKDITYQIDFDKTYYSDNENVLVININNIIYKFILSNNNIILYYNNYNIVGYNNIINYLSNNVY